MIDDTNPPPPDDARTLHLTWHAAGERTFTVAEVEAWLKVADENLRAALEAVDSTTGNEA